MTYRHFIPTILFILTIEMTLSTCSVKNMNQNSESSTTIDTSKTETSDAIKMLETKFDTLIPIFDGQIFVTHNKQKWGAIDVNGNEVVPFICDGIKVLSDSIGIASIYSGSFSLHTGMPRYMYCGKYFLFSSKGRINANEKEFSILIEGTADNHSDEFILFSPHRYVPSDTINIKTCQ